MLTIETKFKYSKPAPSHFMISRKTRLIIIIIIIGIYIAPFPFIKCSKALHIVIV